MIEWAESKDDSDGYVRHWVRGDWGPIMIRESPRKIVVVHLWHRVEYGPFNTLDAAKAAYLMMMESQNDTD